MCKIAADLGRLLPVLVITLSVLCPQPVRSTGIREHVYSFLIGPMMLSAIEAESEKNT